MPQSLALFVRWHHVLGDNMARLGLSIRRNQRIIYINDIIGIDYRESADFDLLTQACSAFA